MKSLSRRMLMTVLAAGLLGGISVTRAEEARAAVAMETVAVGNPGNPGEQSRLSNSDPTFYGGVAYTFWIGKYEVTAGQYTAFLNAVAATDTHGLYNVNMSTQEEACQIQRSGSSGSYTYSVAQEYADRPVNYVSWADAVRFANWLHNGQPTGAQDLTTTEDGSYFLNGISENNDGQLEDVVREPDATWVIPTDNEWYKAAYHKDDGVTGNYWNYPTGTDSAGLLSNDLVDPDPGHHATYRNGASDYTVGSPYWRTEVGEHENSASPYGTFDQGGNVMEFTETVGMIPETRRMRGGSWAMARSQMSVFEIDDVMHSSDQFNDLGFRLATLADPSEPESVPALSPAGLLALVLCVVWAGAVAVPPRRRSSFTVNPGDRSSRSVSVGRAVCGTSRTSPQARALVLFGLKGEDAFSVAVGRDTRR